MAPGPSTAIKVSPQTYYDAARKIDTILGTSTQAFGTLTSTLKANSGMAGNYDGVATWTDSYDSQVQDFTRLFASYANALQNYRDVLNTTGYNWEMGEWNANTDPNKGLAPDRPSVAKSPTSGRSRPI